MPLLSRLIFQAVRWRARRGLCDDPESPVPTFPNTLSEQDKFEKKQQARRTGLRGETYAYWYLRQQGYVFVARNYMPRGAKGELDLVGYDGETLAFVEVRTRTFDETQPAQPELSVTRAKHALLIRTAHRFLADHHVGGHVDAHVRDCPVRFDVLAIDNIPGRRPVVRLHKDALSPQLHR